mgnify:CR=1 FL=1|tara:strand:+ start:51 stop:251 length:201 start_codon:yes stop_codon:yes gene_type:complete
MDGLEIKDGRLLNMRPDGESGIAMAARLRNELKSSKQVRDIASGIELAEQRKMTAELANKLNKLFD